MLSNVISFVKGMKMNDNKPYTYVPLINSENNSNRERVTIVFGIIIISIFPIILSPKLYINLTSTKFYVFAFLTLSYCLVYCIATLLDLKLIRSKSDKHLFGRTITIPQLFLIVFTVWSILSASLSDFDGLFFGQSRFEGVFSVILYSLVFILLSFDGSFTNKYFYSMAIMSLIVGFLAFTQIMGSSILYPAGYNYAAAPFLSTIGNVDCVSGLIAICLPALMVSFVYMKSKLRYLNLAAVVLLAYVQLAIDVDSGKLGIIAAIIIIIPFILNTKQSTIRGLIIIGSVFIAIGLQKIFIAVPNNDTLSFSYEFTHSKFALIILIIGIACIVSAIIMSRTISDYNISRQRITFTISCLMIIVIIALLIAVFMYSGNNPLLTQLSEALHGNLADDAGSGRGIVWKRTISLIKEHPIIGSGTGAYESAFAPYNIDLEETFDFAHNDFLQIAACQGIVGLVLYLGFIVSLAFRAFKNVFKCPWILAFIAPCVGYLVHSFFAFSIAIVTPLFWVIAGILDHVVRQIPADEENLVWPRDELEVMDVLSTSAKKANIKNNNNVNKKKRKSKK